MFQTKQSISWRKIDSRQGGSGGWWQQRLCLIVRQHYLVFASIRASCSSVSDHISTRHKAGKYEILHMCICGGGQKEEWLTQYSAPQIKLDSRLDFQSLKTCPGVQFGLWSTVYWIIMHECSQDHRYTPSDPGCPVNMLGVWHSDIWYHVHMLNLFQNSLRDGTGVEPEMFGHSANVSGFLTKT